MQVCHGKATPAASRCSPATAWSTIAQSHLFADAMLTRARTACRAFTAIGTVKEGVLYQADMGFGFATLSARRRLAMPSRRRLPR